MMFFEVPCVCINFPLLPTFLLAVMKSVNQLLESRLRKFKKNTPNSSSPQELPVPGPSSVLSEREKLIKLIEMFPSHSTEELQDA